MVTSTLVDADRPERARAVPPRSRTGARTRPSSADRCRGRCWPMSPSPMAPSSASVSACKATSASEWPSRRARVGAHAAQPDVVARRQAMHVEALPGAHVGHAVGGSAMARSSAVVSLRLDSLPRTSATGKPAHSATAASSVKVVLSARPRRRDGRPGCRRNGNPCGVCARHRRSRSIVGQCVPGPGAS